MFPRNHNLSLHSESLKMEIPWPDKRKTAKVSKKTYVILYVRLTGNENSSYDTRSRMT